MPVGIQNSQAFYKTFYDDKAMQWLVPDNLPFLNLIAKEDGLSGDVIDHPFLYGPAQGYSADFSTAMANAGTTSRIVRATLRCSQAYSMVEFFDKDRALSLGDAAYMDLIQPIMTGKILDFNCQLDMDLHGSGTGWRGTVGAIAGQTNPLSGGTLAANQIYIATGIGLETAFNQDQALQAATYTGFPTGGSVFPPSDGRAPTTLSTPVQVVAVDAVNRVLTLSDASAFTVNSFIIQAGGAIGFNSSNTYGAVIGMDAWQPYAPGGVPATDNFCGVNRSIYNTRLAGYGGKDLSRLSIEDAIKRLSAYMSQGGARSSNVCLLNPLDFDALDSKLMTNTRYSTVSTATHGFDSIVVNGAAGRIDCLPDPHMVQGFIRLIDPSTWLLRHKMAIPHIVDVEDRQMEQALNYDGRTARLRMYAQLCCMAPHKNGIARIASVNV